MPEVYESLDAWKAEAVRVFGENWMTWAFKCPRCGHVATSQDYKDAGAPTTAVGKECLGRYRLLDGPTETARGCDWAAYGLVDICSVHILVDGKRMPVFEFAPPKEALHARA